MIPTTLATILNDILEAATDAFEQPGTNPVPARAYISHGLTVPWEGEQLTVSSSAVNATHPFPLNQVRGIKTSLIPSLSVVVEIVRECWPEPRASAAAKSLPDPTKLTTAALSLANDASSLYGYLAQQITAGTLILSIPTINTATDFAVGQMVPTGPQGRMAGWKLPISVKLSVAGP